MKKTVIAPAAGNELVEDSDIVDRTAYSRGVVVDHADHKRVFLSGVTPVETADDATPAQVEEVLTLIRDKLADHGGTMNDVVRIRVLVEDIESENFERIHSVRNEFFDPEHHPASTLVEVSGIVRGDIEIEVEAIIPDDGWTTETA